MTLFDLNQKRIIVLTKICSISKFCAMRSHYICIKGMTKSLKIQKRSKYRILQDTGPSYKKIFTHTNNQIFTHTNNHGQTFMRQCQEIMQKWIGLENFDICFCVFF